MEQLLIKHALHVPAMSIQQLENNYNVHDSERQKYYIYNDLVQFVIDL